MGYGLGMLRGMGITLARVIKTFTGDFRHLGRPLDPKEFTRRQSFLVYEPKVDESGHALVNPETGKEIVGYERCTACGICAKVCPPQCIWIVRATTPEGKPRPQAAEFYIDIDVCMNCGYCAEYCPFDAIKMDHDYELGNTERHISHVFDVKTLLKSTTYYSKIHPTDWAREQQESKAKEAAKAKKQAVAP